jgi:hypothetical protein
MSLHEVDELLHLQYEIDKSQYQIANTVHEVLNLDLIRETDHALGIVFMLTQLTDLIRGTIHGREIDHEEEMIICIDHEVEVGH